MKNRNIEKLSVTVIPCIADYKYLICLYREILNSSIKAQIQMNLYSLPAKDRSIKSRLLYPFKIVQLLLKKKNNSDKSVLHIHWIEFLYRWGNNKYVVGLLIPSTIIFLRFFKKIYKNKIAVTAHNIVPHNIHWSIIEYHFFKTMLKEISDIIFVHSIFQKKVIQKIYDLKSEKVFVIQHGLFQKPRLVGSVKKEQYRTKIGMSQSDVVFCFIGTISEYKGVSVLLAAMRELLKKKNNSNIKLILAGKVSNNYLNYLLKNYKDVLSDQHIILINKYLSELELSNILGASDFGICPYVNATTPATVLDFVSYGLPIVTTDDSNVLDIIKDYNPIIFARKNDYLSLANSIDLAYKSSSIQQQKTEFMEKIESFVNAWSFSADTSINAYCL